MQRNELLVEDTSPTHLADRIIHDTPLHIDKWDSRLIGHISLSDICMWHTRPLINFMINVLYFYAEMMKKVQNKRSSA